MSFSNDNTEKGQYAIEGAVTPPSDHGVKNIVETKGAATGEAADIYGDIQTAEQYGYVERKSVILSTLETLCHTRLTSTASSLATSNSSPLVEQLVLVSSSVSVLPSPMLVPSRFSLVIPLRVLLLWQ
jgi:hypothetical protein